MPKIFKSFLFWLNLIIFSLFIAVVSIRIAVDLGEINYGTPEELYRVYIDGFFIGAVDDYQEIANFIDEEAKILQEQYKIQSVHKPSNIHYDKSYTSQGQRISIEQAKDLIKQRGIFTVDGYIVEIEGKEKFNVMSKDDLNTAIQDLVNIYVDKKSYDNLKTGMKYDITKVGEYYDDVYVDNEINITNAYVPVDDTLLTREQISHYLLYGSTKEQQTYTVQMGDDIYSIADKFQLNATGELLIANPNLNEDTILAPGEVVKVGRVDPIIDVIIEKYVVEMQDVAFTTEYVKSSDLVVGYDKVLTQGAKGEAKVSFKILEKNGYSDSVKQIGYELTRKPVNRIIAQGTKVIPNVGNPRDWRWPTRSGYTITSRYGWRGGKFHKALDIAGTGYNSPIYAANNGTVEKVFYDSMGGHQILINHNNGYKTLYAHLAKGSTLVKEGQTVSAGQRIAGMGNSGYVIGKTGIHVHFEVWKNGSTINPYSLY